MSYKDKKKRNILPFTAVLILILLLIISIGFLFQGKDWANLPGNLLVLIVLNLNILLLIILLLLVLRNLIKLYFERKKNIIGAKFRTKLVLAFVSLSLIPAILLFIMASNLISKSIESWFNVHNEEYLKRSLYVAQVYYTSTIGRIFSSARSISHEIAQNELFDPEKADQLKDLLNKNLIRSNIGTIKVLDKNGEEIIAHHNPSIPKGHFIGSLDELIKKGLSGNEYTIVLRTGDEHLIESIVPIYSAKDHKVIGAILFNYYDQFGLMNEITYIKKAFEEYQRRKVFKKPLKMTYMITFLLMTLSIIFSATWFGFYLARGITVPIQKLAEGTKEVASGNLDYKVEVNAKDEIGMLIESFNKMTEDLNKALTGLRESNLEIDRRRKHIETVLTNITSGVITLDEKGLITTVNPAAENILSFQAGQILNKPYFEVMESAGLTAMTEIIDNSVKIKKGDISKEKAQINIHGQIKTLLVSIVNLCGLNAQDEDIGSLVVFDDLTQLIKAQKVATWQEVARRLAHEIKNPLTPIQLSAQRLWKKFQNLKGKERTLMKECTNTIIQEAQGLKTLIDEFSQFARMPESELKPDDLEDLISQTISIFNQIHPECELELKNKDSIPTVMIDRDQIKRVLINLLDNAYESMPNEKKIEIHTCFNLCEAMACVQIKDWGIGIPPEDKEKLLEPYFSKKKGGTGLGLAIVNRIVGDHHGRLIIEDNYPKGTIVSFYIPQGTTPLLKP